MAKTNGRPLSKDFVFRNSEEKGSLVSISFSFRTSWFPVTDCTVMHE